jgi:hypothetical protein
VYQLGTVVRLVDAYTRSQVDGLNEAGIVQLLLNGVEDALGIALPLVAAVDEILPNRQPSALEDHLHLLFIHAQGRSQDTAADVRDVRHV